MSRSSAEIARHPARLGVILALAALALVVGLMNVSAFSPNSSPYNATDFTPSCPPTGGLPAPSSPPTIVNVTCSEIGGSKSVGVSWVSDTPSGSATDDAWGQGTESDCFLSKAGGTAGACVSVVDGIGASKTDLLDFGIGLALGTDNHSYLYGGIKRLRTSSVSQSNANYSIEINQLLPAFKPAAPICLPSFTFTGGCNRWRSPGDITLMTDWGGNTSACGTSTPDICAYIWTTTGPCASARAAPCWGPGVGLGLGNTSTFAAGSIDTSTSTFSETVVDLTAAGLVGGGCETFNQVWAQSRSSSSFTAEMKDFIVGNLTLSTCVQPSIVTTLSSGNGQPVQAGTAVHDSATLGGAITANAGGTVTYRVFTSAANCGTLQNPAGTGATSAGTKTVVNAVVPDSDNVTLSSPGTYYWQAFYSGDNSTTPKNLPAISDCTAEQEVVQLQSSIVTNLSAGTVLAGSQVHDSATLSSTASGAGGSVTYTAYPTLADCQNHTNGIGAGTKTVSSGIVPDSNAVTLTNAGTYYWQAVYSGDTPQSTPAGTGLTRGSSSICTDETVAVQLQSSIVTSLSAGTVLAGSQVHDSATLSSTAAGAGGSVTYTAYPTLADCQNHTSGIGAGTKTVSNGIVPDSNAVTLTNAGTYYWQAVYSGDTPQSTPAGTGLTRGSSSICTDETVVVISPATAISISDQITGLPATGSGSSGTVDYFVYDTQTDCNNAGATGQLADITPSPNTVSGGVVPHSLSYQPAGAGETLYIRATFTLTSASSPIFVSCGEHFTVTN